MREKERAIVELTSEEREAAVQAQADPALALGVAAAVVTVATSEGYFDLWSTMIGSIILLLALAFGKFRSQVETWNHLVHDLLVSALIAFSILMIIGFLIDLPFAITEAERFRDEAGSDCKLVEVRDGGLSTVLPYCQGTLALNLHDAIIISLWAALTVLIYKCRMFISRMLQAPLGKTGAHDPETKAGR